MEGDEKDATTCEHQAWDVGCFVGRKILDILYSLIYTILDNIILLSVDSADSHGMDYYVNVN